jgi:peptide/nickel transport system permease protein
MGFRNYLIKRIVIAFLMLFVVLALNYMIFFLMPGDPSAMFANVRGMSAGDQQKMLARMRQLWGLDQPPEVRFATYLENMLTFNLGTSMTSMQPIRNEIVIRLFWTLELMGGSTILAALIGITLGVLVASKRGGKFDNATVTASLITYSLPVFWMGLVLILVFTIDLGWFPHANAVPPDWVIPGRMPTAYTVSYAAAPQWAGSTIFNFNMNGLVGLLSGYLYHLTLPLATLTLFQYGGYVLLTRATMIEALTEDYVATARAKGVTERNVIFRHALKNASLPLITNVALALGFLLSGAVITEGVFSWPGLGTWIFAAIGMNDYSVLQAAFYLIALCVIIANIVSDVLYGLIDPRVKYG